MFELRRRGSGEENTKFCKIRCVFFLGFSGIFRLGPAMDRASHSMRQLSGKKRYRVERGRRKAVFILEKGIRFSFTNGDRRNEENRVNSKSDTAKPSPPGPAKIIGTVAVAGQCAIFENGKLRDRNPRRSDALLPVRSVCLVLVYERV